MSDFASICELTTARGMSAAALLGKVGSADVPWPLIGWGIALLAALKLLAAGAQRCRVGMGRLMRFYGYRKMAALLQAPAAACLAYWAVQFLVPTGTARSPHPIFDAVSTLVWLFFAGLWWQEVVLPVRGFGNHGKRNCEVITWIGWGVCGVAATISLGQTIRLVAEYEQSFRIADALSVFFRALLPLGLAALVALWPDITDFVLSQAAVRRHLIVEGHSAGWLGRRGIRNFIRRWPRRPPPGTGYLSSGVFMGWTTFESSCRPRDEIEIDDNAHLCAVGMVGGGKKLAMAPMICTTRGSMIAISPKSELADEFCGRRVDTRLFDENAEHGFAHLGIDPRGITQVKHRIPNGRAFVLDPSGQSVYGRPGTFHNLLSEIDLNSPFATEIINAIATGSFPDQPNQRDKFWTLGPRGFKGSAIGHVLTADPDPSHWTLPYVADFCMGVDPVTRRSDPKVFQNNLIAMLKNSSLGGFVQRGAANISEQIGTNAYGSLRAEFENNTRWMTTPWMREHLSHPSHFSYAELGIDDAPVSVFLVPPRGDAAFQATIAWLRTHIELGLQILQTKLQRPSTPTIVICDEMRQYGQNVNALRNGLTILRDARVKLALYAQSWPSLELILGKDAAAELESCSTMQFFACNDEGTAQKISRLLGRHVSQDGRSIVDLVTPAEVMSELRQTSNLQYVFPTASAPMRLERAAHLPVRTREGGRFAGLPLEGHFDNGLSRYTYGTSRS